MPERHGIPQDTHASTEPQVDDIPALIRQSYGTDPWFSDQNNLKSLTMKEGLWYRGTGLVVPDAHDMRKRILYELHDAPYSGHGGLTKTYRAVLRLFWWPNMKRQVAEYIRTCATCQRNKASNQKPAGLLQPLPIPKQPWESVAMDFITHLPRTIDGYDDILVFVDRLTKMCHAVKCKTDVTAEGTAQLFIDNVWKLHGTPENIVSDRGSVFVGKFMTEVLLGSNWHET